MKQNKAFIIIFAAILLLPVLDSLFHFSPVKELFEKRLAIKKPQLSFSSDYPKNFEKYFNDNYGFRKTLISLNSEIMDEIFDESPDARAVIGKDGWLYFDNMNSLLDAEGKAMISNQVIARAVESFYRNWQMLREKNIDYLLIIAPDKSTIYPEFLPNYIKPSGPHRIDKFITALKKKYPDFPLLDLREILLKAKSREIIFHKTDTHWNKRGAHYAYVEIMKKLGIAPHLRSDFLNKENEKIRGDISDIMGSDIRNTDYTLLPKFMPSIKEESELPEGIKSSQKAKIYLNENENLPLLFVYKDSFFGNLINFTAEHFSKSYYFNEFPCDLNYKNIKNFHPNIVIQEFWEGRVEAVLSQCKIN